jgi:hypothetical protein
MKTLLLSLLLAISAIGQMQTYPRYEVKQFEGYKNLFMVDHQTGRTWWIEIADTTKNWSWIPIQFTWPGDKTILTDIPRQPREWFPKSK